MKLVRSLKNILREENKFNIKNHCVLSKAGRDEFGHLKINQDTYLFIKEINGIKNFDIFGVLDGHGPEGHFVSQLVSRYIQLEFQKIKAIERIKDVKIIYQKLSANNFSIIKDIFINADNFLRDQEIESRSSGTTCVLVIHIGNHIICANVGDSRAILIYDKNKDHDYKVFPLSIDNKPEINGVVLSGNKSLSDFGIQPVLHSGVATNLNNNKVDVQYLAGVLGVDTSNRLYADTYTTAQIDNMLASLRTIRYEATKPAVPVRNTLYYVGTSSPYHMWLYDSYGTEIDLGTSDVRTYSAGPGIAINSSNVISADLDTIINVGSTSVKAPTSAAVAAYAETKDNKVTSISAASTNEQYPSAKLLYDQLQTKIGAVAASDTSLQVLGGTTLTHATPADLGGADTKGTTKKIPQITYDKFGHLHKVEEKDLEVPLSSADTSLMLNASNELTHVVPSNLGAGATVGGQTAIPQITYDKFGHLQKVDAINVYPPTTAGLNGQLWVSDGVEAGAWTALSSLIRVKSETGTSTTSGSTTIVVNAPAADAGYVRLACIGAYISSTVDGVCWSVPSMTDSQVTFYANGWTGSATITAYTQWLYVRSNG